MMKGVNDAWIEIISKHGNMEKEMATAKLNQWKTEKRYICDIWH
jgi:sulfite reductase alpha subunit-like flavoprotein